MSPGLPAGSAVPVPEGGLACFAACRPCRLFEFFPPSPRPPSRREGGVSKFILPGASPPAPLRPGGKRHWLFLWKAVPEGGLPALPPADLAVCLPFCPHPPSPLPSGKGGDHSFLMQGASPLASPGLNPGGTGFSFGRRCPRGACPRGCRLALLYRCPRGGLPALPPADLAVCLLFCPHPPDPLPGGKGETLGYFMQGASPLASPALNRLRHLQTLPFRYPGASLPWNRA